MIFTMFVIHPGKDGEPFFEDQVRSSFLSEERDGSRVLQLLSQDKNRTTTCMSRKLLNTQ
jgi:hypothetical protein